MSEEPEHRLRVAAEKAISEKIVELRWAAAPDSAEKEIQLEKGPIMDENPDSELLLDYLAKVKIGEELPVTINGVRIGSATKLGGMEYVVKADILTAFGPDLGGISIKDEVSDHER